MRGRVQRVVALLLLAILIPVMNAAQACAAACVLKHQAGSTQMAMGHADAMADGLSEQPAPKPTCLSKGFACRMVAMPALQSAAFIAAPDKPRLPPPIEAAVFGSLTHPPPERPPMTPL